MSIFDQQTLTAAQTDAQLENEKLELLQNIHKTRTDFESGCLCGFNRVWRRVTKEEVQKFLNRFTLEQQQEIFAQHAAAMAFLSTLPGFVPQIPPYEFTWGEDGIVIGDLRQA